MTRQEQSAPDSASGSVQPCTDAVLLDAATEVITGSGYAALTLSRLAEAAGSSRMTLHRREVTLAGVVAGLSLRAAERFQAALYPALVGAGPASDRLTQALDALFDLADEHLPLLVGLFSDDDGIFHGQPDETGALPTDPVFVAPFAKLLGDGAADGTLRPVRDRTESATVLFNTVGWGYVQLRHSQRWPAGRARAALLDLLLPALLAP